MRYLDATEDDKTESMNFIKPIKVLKRIDGILNNEISNADRNNQKYLISRFNELKQKYNIK